MWHSALDARNSASTNTKKQNTFATMLAKIVVSNDAFICIQILHVEVWLAEPWPCAWTLASKGVCWWGVWCLLGKVGFSVDRVEDKKSIQKILYLQTQVTLQHATWLPAPGDSGKCTLTQTNHRPEKEGCVYQTIHTKCLTQQLIRWHYEQSAGEEKLLRNVNLYLHQAQNRLPYRTNTDPWHNINTIF